MHSKVLSGFLSEMMYMVRPMIIAITRIAKKWTV